MRPLALLLLLLAACGAPSGFGGPPLCGAAHCETGDSACCVPGALGEAVCADAISVCCPDEQPTTCPTEVANLIGLDECCAMQAHVAIRQSTGTT